MEALLKSTSNELGITFDPVWVQLLGQNGFQTVDSLKELSQVDWIDIGLPLRVYKKLSAKGYTASVPPSGPPKPRPLKSESSKKSEKAPSLDQLFKEIDTDGSGYIDTHELRTCIQKLGVELDHENALLLLKRVDKNNDFKIGRDEFGEMVTLVQEVKANFDSIDLDGSHSISISELSDYFNRLGFNFSKDLVDQFADLFDEDKSGSLDYQEFFNLTLYLRELNYLYQRGKKHHPDTITQYVLGHQKSQHKTAKKFIEKNPNPHFEEIVKLIFELKFSGKSKKVPKVIKVRDQVREKRSPKKSIPLAKHKVEASNLLKSAPSTSQKPTGGSKFEDKEFPPNDRFLPTSIHSKVSSWRRISELSQNPQLFVSGVEEGDVIQGQLGDCWFISALSVLAANGTELIEDVFIETDFSKGYVKCKIFKDGEWRIVEIDDRLPCGVDGKPVFASAKDPNEFWVSLIEKAYAKIHGGYQNLEGGSISDGLRDLSGEAVQTIYLDDKDVPEAKDHALLWKTLLRNMKESFLMGCSFSSPVAQAEEATPQGLLLNHAYAIIDAQEVKGNKLMRIRNPWGSHEWNGDWSDKSSKWTNDIKAHFKYEFGDDGTFFMAFEDFVQHFNRIQVLLLMTDNVGQVWNKKTFNSEWKGKSAGGCRNHPTWTNNPQFALQVKQNTTIFCSLSQPDIRVKKSKKDDLYPALGVFAFKVKDTTYKALGASQDQIVLQSGFITCRDISCEFEAEAGQNYILVPCYFQDKLENPFSFSIYSQKPVTAFPIEKEMKENSVHGKWGSDNSGGCTNHPTWRKNPMYVLTTSHSAKVIISLEQIFEGDQDPYTMGLYIFKSSTKNRILTPKDAINKPKFSNVPKATTEIQIEPNQNYILMPCTFEPNKHRPFKISVFLVEENSSISLSIDEATQWQFQQHLDGKWTNSNSGGCMNHKTWKENPKYLVQIHDQKIESQLNVLVSVKETGFALGGHIFKGDSMGEMKEILGNIDFVQGYSSLGTFTIPSGISHLVVLPCTFQPGQIGDFTLDFYSSSKMSISRL